jgi:murein DD-endopeptidase MepM/ murein hydrolase activator NlpD
VLSIENGIVIETGKFSSSKEICYWNETYYILVKNQDDYYCKCAELKDILVEKNEDIKIGQIIGHVGQVLNSEKINNNSPSYIQKLKQSSHLSMLHFELYQTQLRDLKKYRRGNWFGCQKPKQVLNPQKYFKNII